MELTDISIENVECTQKVGGNVFYSPTPHKVIDFSGFSNILKTPKNILKALKKVNPGIRPDIEYKKVVLNIAKKHSVEKGNIVLEKNRYAMIDTILKALRARCAMIVMPEEPLCKDICRMNNCDVMPFVLSERKNFKFSSDDFIDFVSSKTDVVFISNPNNATGRAVSKGEIRNILDYCLAKGIYVIVDETYIDFVPDGQSVSGLISEYYNLVVIRSIAEYYNLAGVEVVYAVSCPEIIDSIKESQLPWNIDIYGTVLCENAFNNDKFDLKTKKWIFEEKKKFVNKLKALNNVRVINSDCHFVLVKLEDISATTVYNRLLKNNILIRDASAFTGLDGSYIRIAVRDEKSNELLIESLLKCLI